MPPRASARRRTATVAALLLLLGAGLATAVRADAPAANDPDLSVAAVRHWAECPLPKESACVLRKPVDTGYRVLTSGADLNDAGDHWIADFSKLKKPETREMLLRVLDRNGGLHEIVVKFPPEPIPPKAPAKKKRRLGKPSTGKPSTGTPATGTPATTG